MKAAIETREIITVSADGGIRLRGTYHKPQGWKSNVAQDPDEKNRVGVLFVSAGVSPRAAYGDSAVLWADSLAKSGYPSFRFDLPGLGDSDGDLSSKEIDFDSLVNEGAFGPVVSNLANHLVDRFNLRSVVVAGHCAGAVTALYSAAANKRITGLILLDPYFHVPQTNEIQNVLVRSQLSIVRKLVGDRLDGSIVRDAGAKVLSGVREIYHRVQPIRRLVRRKKLPGTANQPLVRCWNQLASAGLPMLVLRSPFDVPKPGEFDYVTDLHPLSASGCHISVKLVEGATHAFSERPAKEAFLTHTEQWFSACFPLRRSAEARTTEHRSPELSAAISGIPTNVS